MASTAHSGRAYRIKGYGFFKNFFIFLLFEYFIFSNFKTHIFFNKFSQVPFEFHLTFEADMGVAKKTEKILV